MTGRHDSLLPLPDSPLASRNKLAEVTRSGPLITSSPAPTAAETPPRAHTPGNASGTCTHRDVATLMLAIIGDSASTGNGEASGSSASCGNEMTGFETFRGGVAWRSG